MMYEIFTCRHCGYEAYYLEAMLKHQAAGHSKPAAEAEAKPSNDLDLLTQEIGAMKQHLVQARQALDTNSFAECAWEIDAALKVGFGATVYDEGKHGPRPQFKTANTQVQP